MSATPIDPKPLPEVGKFQIDQWADLLDCSTRTIKNDIATHAIATFHCGGKTIIDAALWWKAIAKEGRK